MSKFTDRVKKMRQPLGLTLPSRLETAKGTMVVMLSMAICSAFVAGVDMATAMLVSKF